jgi:hypothetical protein
MLDATKGRDAFIARLKSLIPDRKENKFARTARISASGLRGMMKHGNPTRESLVAIAETTGVDLNWLCAGGDVTTLPPKPALKPASGPAESNPIIAQVLIRLGDLLDDYLSHDCDRETVVDEFNAALDALSWFREKAPMQRKPGGGDA